MRVLLVTWTDKLLDNLRILNPELECCAIVVDEVEPAKKILRQVGMTEELLHPLYELKECVKDFYYDYVLCVENTTWADDFLKIVEEFGVAKNKILGLNVSEQEDFFIERVLRYFKEHSAEFEMFATGMSYAEVGLDGTHFKRRLFNFARSSQDLYYNLQIAKFVVSCEGHTKLRYALIELAPYIFHYDLSKSTHLNFLMMHYLIAFNDLHNFFVPADVYKKFLCEEYLNSRLSIEPFDVNNPFLLKKPTYSMTPQKKIKILKSGDERDRKVFPETRKENVKILNDYLTLCEENNIRPIMILMPMSELYMKIYPRRQLDEYYYLIEQACKKHSRAIFIDGWKLQGLTDKDFYDYGHMNTHGAAKFSAFLNNIVEQIDVSGSF